MDIDQVVFMLHYSKSGLMETFRLKLQSYLNSICKLNGQNNNFGCCVTTGFHSSDPTQLGFEGYILRVLQSFQ